MELYIKILKEASKFHGASYSRHLSKLIADWLEATGNTNATILSKVNGKIHCLMGIDSGIDVFAIGDPSWFAQHKDYIGSESEDLKLVNQGELFIFYSDPSETPYNVQLRIIECSEPILTVKEYKCVLASSQTAVINIPSNSVMVANPYELSRPDNQLTIPISPGHYKINVHHFYIRNKLDSFYIVLCKTDKEANNHWLQLTTFSMEN